MIYRTLAALVVASALSPSVRAAELRSVTVPGRVPSSLGDAELAMNRADENLFFKNAVGNSIGGRLLVPDVTGAVPLLDQDRGMAARLGTLPPAVSFENVRLLPGNYGVGGTVMCERPSSPTASVRCNLVAQGSGGHLFTNANGALLGVFDGGSLTTAYPTITPGTSANGSIATFGTSAFGHLYFSSPGGVSIGASNQVSIGTACVSIGNGNQCRGSNNLATGNQAYDFGSVIGARLHASAPVPGVGIGSNQILEQTLQVSLTTASAVRMSYSGSASYTNGTSLPVQSSGHGTFALDVECTKISTGDTAFWSVKGNFVRVVNALRFPTVTGAGTPTGGDSALNTMSLSVTPDTTNSNFNISITPPSGNGVTIGCTAYGRLQQRIS